MEKRRHILYTAFFLLTILAAFDFLGIKLYFFWVYWWYDVVMHFLAGVIGGLATYWVLFESGHFLKLKREGLAILAVFICVMAVGVAWEIFEYKFGIVGYTHEGYKLDTMNDLILDGAGALLAGLLTTKKRNG